MSRRKARATIEEMRRAVEAAKATGMAAEVLPDGTIRFAPAPVDNGPKRVEPTREIIL